MYHLRTLRATTSSIRAQLFNDEQLITQQPGVGLYDGKDKDDRFPDGTLLLTSHRLIYIDSKDPHSRSCFLDLRLVRKTEFWVGFLKSSPKITLLLGEPTLNSGEEHHRITQQNSSATTLNHSMNSDDQTLNHPAASHWACHVCGFSNPHSAKCGLCGIPRQSKQLKSPTRGSFGPPSSFSTSSDHLPIRSISSSKIGRATSLSHLGGRSVSFVVEETSPRSNDSATKTELACGTCTYLNHPSMLRCEMCDSLLGSFNALNLTSNDTCGNENRIDGLNGMTLKGSETKTESQASLLPENSYIRLSFRKGGDKTFYEALKTSLQTKHWEKSVKKSRTISDPSTASSENTRNFTESSKDFRKAIGIDGILRNIDSNHQADCDELSEGLQDLKALMSRAKDMVQLARSINGKLTALENSSSSMSENRPTEQSAALIRSSLVKLGLPTPAVTADMIASDKEYSSELAKELAGFITRITSQTSNQIGQKPFSKGILSIDEVWCMWNRARGVLPVSPTDMLCACQFLPLCTNPPIQLHTFRSGLKVLHSPYYSTKSFADRLLRRLNSEERRNLTDGIGWITTLEVAQLEGVTVSLATELIEMVEQGDEDDKDNEEKEEDKITNTDRDNNFRNCNMIVRDLDPRTGIYRWYPNLISEFYNEQTL
ncbi:EAP30/Vps36 family-domain-containing protein [Phakopsora pachyrhizi]|uniref:Vacuolar protein-sorting-associated protein 36 n=1 Tax=Phakopsora pachyrhizi TaxID=170000 RepID=A0AAV0BTA1_PHAPC|nr:EAP30/Vps36 family-domain-containing protein [Phakopsora pachyrhizi]CAH7689935.1 EAP30/Vps36 family-domain-containing protein [Phakopsora pachyrhizi]